ncbi:hypothetical protein V5F41_08215 [Xanthobacter autotrophicus]|uniref:hypothetical protein n=1 Tax=Xanthobacter autotrophicus TaxID=280 RepID=UPI00372B3F5F
MTNKTIDTAALAKLAAERFEQLASAPPADADTSTDLFFCPSEWRALAALLRGVVDGPKAEAASNQNYWGWWAGQDEEVCTIGPCGSRDEVIAEAKAERLGEFQDDEDVWKLKFHICEAEKAPLRLSDWIDFDDLMDRAEEAMSDSDRVGCDGDEGPWFDATKEQQADLEKRIHAACNEWQTDHGLVFTCMTFSSIRHDEQVVCSHPLDDAPSPPLSTTKEG